MSTLNRTLRMIPKRCMKRIPLHATTIIADAFGFGVEHALRYGYCSMFL